MSQQVKYVKKTQKPPVENQENTPQNEQKQEKPKKQNTQKYQKYSKKPMQEKQQQNDNQQVEQEPQEQKQQQQKPQQQPFKQQQQYQNDQQRQKKPWTVFKDKRYEWNSDKITCKTEIPNTPTASELLNIPSHADLIQSKTSLNKKIDQIIQETQEKKSELQKQQREAKIDVKSKLDEQNKIQKEVADFKKVFQDKQNDVNEKKAQVEQQKATISQINTQLQQYEKQIPVGTNLYELQTTLENKERVLMNAQMTLYDERQLQKEIDQIKKALPLLEPINKLKKQRDQEYTRLNSLFNDLKQLYVIKDEHKQLWNQKNDELKAFKESKAYNYMDINPLVKELHKIANAQIGKYEAQMEQAVQSYKDKLYKYREQQNLIYYIEWLTKQVEWKKKNEVRQKDQLERKERSDKRKEAAIARKAQYDLQELEKQNQGKYQNDIDAATLLISYFERLIAQPNKNQKQEEAKKIDEQHVLKVLQSGEYKKEKLTYLKPTKTDENQDFVSHKKQKNKKVKPANEKEENNDSIKVNQVEVLQYLDHLKIAPPTQKSQIQTILQQIKEKKEYYEGLNKELLQKLEAEKQEAEEAFKNNQNQEQVE